jgi:hypothetical protein
MVSTSPARFENMMVGFVRAELLEIGHIGHGYASVEDGVNCVVWILIWMEILILQTSIHYQT